MSSVSGLLTGTFQGCQVTGLRAVKDPNVKEGSSAFAQGYLIEFI